MSSAEDTAPRTKRRKVQRACDQCRRKKRDGLQMPNNRCSRCATQSIECTFTGSPSKRHYPSRYVETIENRLKRMEQLVNQLHPDGEGPSQATGHQSGTGAESSNTPVSDTPGREGANPLSGHATNTVGKTPDSSDEYESSDDDQECKEVVEGLEGLTLDSPSYYRYHGKSSGLVFLRSAIEVGARYTARNQTDKYEQRHLWLRPTVIENLPVFSDYPPRDLLNTLVDLYFQHMNISTPVLHEPTFKKAVADGLHHRHGTFGATVLLVCANGARFSHDPRVYTENDPKDWISAGWKWYEPVERICRFPLAPIQLYDLQVYALMVLFLQATRSSHSTWPLIGVGLRMAIDAGVHRKKKHETKPTVEGELWKRAFWSLVYAEWTNAYGLGRPASIHSEDMDAEYPLEVDDEYWTTPDGEPLFQQPPEKPSIVSFWVYSIKLIQIIAFASRTIYSINKFKAQHGRGGLHWEERMVAELDSEINKWVDSLPPHTRWDPNREQDSALFTQSATLFAHHYHTQIAIHRPFISAARQQSPLSFPSLVICMNAARSAIQLIETIYKRTGTPYHRNVGTLFISSVVLLMNMMARKRSVKPVTANSDMVYVTKSLHMLECVKHQTPIADGLRELLQDMMDGLNARTESQVNGPTSEAPLRADLEGTSQSQLAEAWPTYTTTAVSSSSQVANCNLQGYAATSHSSPLDNNSWVAAGPLMSWMPSQTGPDPPMHVNPASPNAASSSTGPQMQQPLYGTEPSMSATQVSNSPGSFGFPQNATFEFQFLGYDSMSHINPDGTTSAQAETQPLSMLDPATAALVMGFPGSGDGTQQDLGSMDETMDMWSNAPPAFGWDDWSAYVDSANNRGANA